MATGRSNKYGGGSPSNTSMYIYSVKVSAYDKPIAIGHDGEMKIEYSENGSFGTRKSVSYPLISAWVDPVNTQARNTCKAYGLIPQKPKTPEGIAAKLFAQACFDENGYACYIGSPSQMLTVDLARKVIRFGAKEELYLASNQGDYTSAQPIYDTKSMAIKAILDALGGYSTAKIAGLDLINLNRISDRVLEELGFVKVPDVCGRGVAMWTGDATKALSMGSASYSTNRWRSSWDRNDDDVEKATQSEVVESFLNLLEVELTK